MCRASVRKEIGFIAKAFGRKSLQNETTVRSKENLPNETGLGSASLQRQSSLRSLGSRSSDDSLTPGELRENEAFAMDSTRKRKLQKDRFQHQEQRKAHRCEDTWLEDDDVDEDHVPSTQDRRLEDMLNQVHR